jgi:hypothetical protein
MAMTDARPGFRLPWSADRSESDEAQVHATAPAETASPDPADPPRWTTAAGIRDTADSTTAPGLVTVPAPVTVPVAAAPRTTNRLIVELSRAMKAVAEAAREETLVRLRSDVQACVEGIHLDAAARSAGLNGRADEDVAGIEAWSKAEIARIEDETEQRISARRIDLDREIADLAARTGRRIEDVEARVVAFEAEMSSFFERIALEDDPRTLAELAETLPEPPAFTPSSAAAPDASAVVSEAMIPNAVAPTIVVERIPTESVPADDAFVAVAAVPTVGARANLTPVEAPIDLEAAFAAIQAAAEAAAEEPDFHAPVAAPMAAPFTAPVPSSFGTPVADPRLAALGLTEASVVAAVGDPAMGTTTDDRRDDVPLLETEAPTARLAVLPPGGTPEPVAEILATKVVVVGLISVASIASFKRHLARLPGVRSVGVSSGPDGEFVFAVAHGPEVVLRDIVPTLPGFGARVIESTDDSVSVLARDPDTES